MNYDPSPEAVFDRIVPKFTASLVQCAVVEAYASEQGARRTAMESATDNADAMTESLSLLYNRARQASITRRHRDRIRRETHLNNVIHNLNLFAPALPEEKNTSVSASVRIPGEAGNSCARLRTPGVQCTKCIVRRVISNHIKWKGKITV